MKKTQRLFLLTMLFALSGWLHGQLLQPFKDDVESHADFQQNGLVGWTSLDVDGLVTAGPFQSFPGKGGPLGFIVYNPSQTDPVNTLPGYDPRSGQKYFASISSYSGPSNDWLISSELAAHTGGTFSFYAKSAADFAGLDRFKVAYSTTGSNPADFTFVNATPTTTTMNWARYQFTIPNNAKYVAINCVSQAFMMLVDDIEFTPTVAGTAPNTITNFSSETQMNSGFQAVFNWTNPTLDNAGNALSSMTGVKVYRGTHPMNLVEIANLPSAVGQAMTYTDNLPGEGSYTHRFVPYNASGNGVAYNTPITFFGYETVPGAPANITFTQNGSLQTVISWNEVNYGQNGGVLQNPVVGYKITRTLGSSTVTLAEMHTSTTFTETTIPAFNLYTYTITAMTSPTNPGIPAAVPAYSGMNANQVSVTSGNSPSDQPFELSRGSIISQSIYKPEEIGGSGLITSISYFGNLGATSTARYKIYMSTTNRNTFGTTTNNAVWEYFGNQKLLFDGNIQFVAGRNATTIEFDQPFYYDASSNQNVIITIVKPLLNNPPSVNPREFYNTPVEGMRTYFSIGYSVDLSVITSQPAAWTLEEVITIPSIVVEKTTDFASVSGTVTLFSDGSPMEGVTVSITPEDSNAYQTETTITNASGGYQIPALIPGNYVATFSKNTFNTVEIEFTVTPNQQLVLDAVLDNSLPILISGRVVDVNGNGLEGINLNLTGFSEFNTVSDAAGNFTLEAFADKQYELEAAHPLFISETVTFTSEDNDHTIDTITLELALNKPGNVVAVNNEGVGEVEWRVPVGQYNETMLGWGSFITTGDAWGNGGDPFIAGVRFETSDLHAKLTEGAELTHVRVYFANNANAVIKIFEGPNAEQLVHSQPVSIPSEDWYVIELTQSLAIDFTKELWIGVEFLAGQYGAYPIGLDDGPNAPGRKGSMKYENGAWLGMSLTNKNWNIYGIANNTMEADPAGYKVYRSPATEENWTELTPSPITSTTYNDTTLNDAAPNMYKYGVEAIYGDNLISEKGISNEIEHNMFFDFTLNLDTDFGSAEGAYVSVWNDENFAEAFVPASGSVTLNQLMHGNYNVRVELNNYEIAELSNVVVEEGSNVTVPLNLLKVQPSNLTADVEGNSARLDWTLHDTFTDKIEKYADFERQTIGNYIMKDLDGLGTYTYNNFSWPNAGIPMAFMVFNPHATTPPVNIPSLSGRRFLTAFAGPDGANNDWLIIPAGSGEFSFNAASLTNEMLERMRVLYSTTGTEVSDFTAFGNQITVPATWTEYSYDAPEGTKYVAINFVSNDSYILKIDDLTYEKEYNHALYYRVYLDGELVVDNLTEMNYLLDGLITQPTHIAEVEAVYNTGASEKTEIIISRLNTEDHNLSEFAVYPNPSSGKFWLKVDKKAAVKIFDLNGRILYSGEKEAGTSMMEQKFSAGTYIIQVQTEKGITSKKLIFK
ncbi:carboxypeptidase regulatory-like domain-containing protein [Moheibacter sediminis]|uniref:Por secretion system C-terminal sorting domain-containing protein n=1 Tax=Moheibacter sediminis TaxID=1434700 RepID=A0A1W2BBG7_9FLAO|nr:carboxypeptidase regulatory-like domain-containing protein [Moheibacter sediminis]SMC70373.1 Por secretion system C-terminal sorting domain-containing protein [Moheibacter sediminis]